MKKKSRIIITFWLLLIVTLFAFNASAQMEKQKYYSETDPLVLKKLEKWQDIKFGLLMHWAPYSQWGILASWSICGEDEGWITAQRRYENYEKHKAEYKKLQTTFNPVNFNPEKWAAAAKRAGMKYMVFTTKHHDGFCMFDTKYTDYKITDPNVPFHKHPRANITKEIFTAFRNQGFMIGAYFSKPDWNSPYFWRPEAATPDRNPNYSLKQRPEIWDKFVEYTHNQIGELTTEYGKLDILWLDGGWIQPYTEQEIWAYRAQKNFKQVNLQSGQDIKMEELVKRARSNQPGLIVVDRAVEGPYQNYITPENRIPDKALDFPWESPMTAGNGWSWRNDNKIKSAREVIHMLVDIVSKGGNLLLNIAPDGTGEYHPDAYKMLENVGEWMDVNSEAIYNTRPIAPCKEGKVSLTSLKNGAVYMIYCADKDENNPPSKLWFSSIQPAKDAKITMLGTKVKLRWEKVGKGMLIHIPESIQKEAPCQYAWVVKISKINTKINSYLN